MKKIKLLAAAIALVLSIFTLASCASDVTAYSPDSRISIVYSELDSTDTQKTAYNKIVGAIKEYIGTNCRNITDDLLQSNFEIVVGESNREVTRLAKEYLAANALNDGDTEAYVFYYKDNAIAIVGTSDFAMEIAADKFVEKYITSDTLVVSSNMCDFTQFSKTAYLAAKDAEITAEEEESWEHRWDKVRALVGKEGTEAIQRLYEFWGTEWLEWVVGLYDPAYGGFYYSASARDYYGFEPDIESTAQIFNLLKEMGLFSWYKDGYWAESLPADFRAKLGEFVANMQSEADGYFYHPQWGKDIGTSAKGRHLDQAIYLLGVAGIPAPFRTPYERQESAMGGTSAVITAFMQTDEHQSSVILTDSSLPDYMQSEEAIINYLNEQWEDHYDPSSGQNSYGFAHLLSSQAKQLKASGYIDVVCDWIDEHQDPETGFWEPMPEDIPDRAYRAISGLIKFSGVYGNANRPFKYADKMVDTAIEIMLSDVDPAHVCYIYNPIGAFKSILNSFKLVGMDTTAARQKFIYRLPDIISKTIEKQQVFRKELGSFSYTPLRSDPSSQGLRMSLGLAEGDVNAIAVSIHYLCDGLFGALGVPIVPLFRYADYKWFIEQIENAGSPIKEELVLETIDFEDGSLSDRMKIPEVADLDVDVVDSGKNDAEDAYAMQIHRGPNATASTTFVIDMTPSIVPMCTSVELDMKFVSSQNTGYLFSLTLGHNLGGSGSRTGYELHFYVVGDGTVRIHEVLGSNPQIWTDAIATVAMGDWFKLRFEYYPLSSTDVRIKLYLNDTCIHIEDRPFDNYYDQKVHNGMNRLHFSCFSGKNEAVVMLDNISTNHDASKQFDDSDFNPGGAE